MPVNAELLKRGAKRPDLLLNGDKRRHRRLPLSIAGRFMRADRIDYDCQLRDISVGGASIMTQTHVSEGENIVAYFQNLGGLEGTVVRTHDQGFAIQFRISDHKREKLAAQITWLINREDFPDEFGRAHERLGMAGRKTTLKVEDGIVVDVDLLDVSVSGASVGTTARPAIGCEVSVARLAAIVRRHHEKGIGVEFVRVLPEASLRAHFP
ncbi:MAG: pilus assembly protein PilZ [Hyphomicrobium sp.]|nr:MAG: pilus assembly protein PilZ [Hyphomicrobium sp.]PPC99721.1 MAG: pilus assembly protein PilZ [Hyphomicrobium sp.]